MPTFVTRRIYELVMAGKLPEARTWQMRLTQLFDRVFGEDFPEGARAAIEARGFTFGRGRQPVGQSDMHVRAGLGTAIKALLTD